ncbi:MAG: MFS transporter [Sciscionella sp.]
MTETCDGEKVSSRPRAPRGLPPMVVAIAATTIGQLPVFLTGALAVQIGHDMALPASRLGIVVAAFFASSALCSAGLGRLSDRLGGTRMMRLGIVPAVAALLWIGLGVHRWGELVPALVIAGVANGAIQPAANRYLARTVGDDRQGFAFGVKQAAIPAATLLSGLAVPAVGATVGWRWAYLGAAVLAVAVGALIPRRGRAGVIVRTVPDGAPPEPRTFARSALIILAIGVGMGSAAANALGSFFVLSAVHIGVSDSHAGLTAAAGSVVSLVVRLGIGFRADRRSSGHLRLVSGLCACGAIGLLLLALGAGPLLVPAAVIGYGVGWGWAGLFNFAVVRTHPTVPGRATGLTQVGASSGACLGPLGFSIVATHLGYPSAWVFGAALLLAAGAVILVGRRALYAAGVVG